MCQSCTSFFVIASAVFYGMAINKQPADFLQQLNRTAENF
jgi:hypothetical protein